ncbi:hypothetical protein U1Q18_039233 [Sarracenia purpurea var. burkii]
MEKMTSPSSWTRYAFDHGRFATASLKILDEILSIIENLPWLFDDDGAIVYYLIWFVRGNDGGGRGGGDGKATTMRGDDEPTLVKVGKPALVVDEGPVVIGKVPDIGGGETSGNWTRKW